MTGAPEPQEPVFLDAILRPSPPLPAFAALLVLGVMAAVNFGFGMLFALQGAWPVLPFFGLDVAALALAFRTVRRRAGAFERLVVSPSELRLTRVPHKGPPSELRFQAYWVRVSLEDDVEPARRLTLSSHGRSAEIGRFLSPDERQSLAQRLKSALAAAKVWRPG